MILLNRSEEIVLVAIWKLGDKAYGVPIRDLVSSDTGHDWSFGAVYKPLKQLVHRGYAEKIAGDPSPERGGRSRFYYRLTPDGHEALREIRKIYRAVWTKRTESAFD